ncbi:hypothetical protein [Aggregatibacter actinomycetemcomitans]|jgi:uncharacterized protein y4jS|uniref:phosphorylase family protein n=1 Tax=Aggregatibacter actinomycetemcomitans TaxID=714 RepID=UPI001E3D0936|nr:hypothetical protein [Aggregatibacter actinomycetemcomitans]
MIILIIEDDQSKLNEINDYILNKYEKYSPKIDVSGNLSDARRKILANSYDIVIFDIFLPLDNSFKEAVDISNDILSEFNFSKNYQSESIAITKFNIKDIPNIDRFNELAINVVQYNCSDDKWKSCLDYKINKVLSKITYDFIIFCALSEERSAYYQTECNIGESRIIKGLDCVEVDVEGAKGLCIVPPRMGLVNMAITATKAIEYFQPKLVAISGICAGVQGSANYLDVIIGNPCWEYEVGKHTEKKFKIEPYQISINDDVQTELKKLSEDEETLKYIKQDLYDTPLKSSVIRIAPIASGAAVVADKQVMDSILEQHRKLSGIEMEMSAVYASAKNSLFKPKFFGAKAVVDLGDSQKNDDYHNTGCILSARFIVSYLKKYL